ncbi:substrate-binding periplasmic protein [Pseudomonas sp. SP16.1]|uniref:substrate-binding periplasmic protein n=1 Tax=Pseudomonas sp. SP16.1 TaxID=3458854 RepID=UPI004046877F
MKRLSWLLLCLGLLACPVVAQQEVRVGVELQPYRPYSDVRDGVYQGYGRELLDAFARHQGYHFVYVPLPVRRLLNDFLGGRVDLKFPDHPQWNAEQKAGHTVRYSQPAAPYVDGVLVKPEHLGRGLARIRLLGTQNGFTPWPYLDEIHSGRLQLIQASQIDSLLRMALGERVDAVYLNPQVVAHHLREMQLPAGTLAFDSQLPHVEDHYYVSSIQRPQLIDEFDRFLREQAALVAQIRLRHGL